MKEEQKMTFQRIGTRQYGNGEVVHTPLIRAGDWIFGTGLRANLPSGEIDPDVERLHRPFSSPPKAQREAQHIFDLLVTELSEHNSAITRVARLDQYFTHHLHVDPYHVVRKKSLQGQVAPSTSILIKGLLNTDACMDVQMIASTLQSTHAFDPVAPSKLNVPTTSGYAPCLRVGDLIFVAGQLARDASGQIAASAQVPEGQLWNGTRIKLETEYLIEHRLMPALAAAGSNLDLVLKAQVYLSNSCDLAQFWQVWAKAFGNRIPPTTVVPVAHPGFGTEKATIEINLIAAHQDAAKDIKDIDCDVELIGQHMVPARSFQQLLFVAGLMAIEDGGLCHASKPSTSAPYYTDSARQQSLNILAKAKTIFKAAQTDLSYLTRAIHFQSDLNEFNSIYQAWDPELRRAGLPFTAVEVGSELFVNDAALILDLWGYIPR